MNLKEKILKLRMLNFSYNEISKKLGCSKSTISHHCKNAGQNKPVVLSPEKAIAKIEKAKIKRRKTYDKKIMDADISTLKYERLRRRILLEQKRCCLICGIDNWNKEPITLELDHIDGDNKNNSRENLRCLCPNCHSQTRTWRGRNKKTKRFEVSDKELLDAILKNDFNFRKSLIDVGLSPKGGNYKRCHKLKLMLEDAT